MAVSLLSNQKSRRFEEKANPSSQKIVSNPGMTALARERDYRIFQ
jgi:hypothetical protein